MAGGSKKGKIRKTFHSEKGALMTRKTVEIIIAVIAFATEILRVIKEKMNGRKDDDKRASKEK
jgi:hypothetical protein